MTRAPPLRASSPSRVTYGADDRPRVLQVRGRVVGRCGEGVDEGWAVDERVGREGGVCLAGWSWWFRSECGLHENHSVGRGWKSSAQGEGVSNLTWTALANFHSFDRSEIPFQARLQ